MIDGLNAQSLARGIEGEGYVEKMARAAEILVSSEARDALLDDFRFGEPRGLSLKGFSGSHAAFPLAWEG